ncbi:hypothetical protein LR68_01246 [Anoxybacillus sp. BCO1]|nr:hypothetical protein LR68_01246 [Anoxybacillus sp. BCO1]
MEKNYATDEKNIQALVAIVEKDEKDETRISLYRLAPVSLLGRCKSGAVGRPRDGLRNVQIR